MGGSLQGRLWPRSDQERAAAEAAGYDVSKLLFIDDLCKGEQVRGVPLHPPCAAAVPGVQQLRRQASQGLCLSGACSLLFLG